MLLPIKIETEIQKFPLFTCVIIAANAIVFISMLLLPRAVLEMAYHDFGFSPDRLDALTLITSMFIHAGWLHIIGNMYFLWLFGRAIEQHLNRSVFVLLYVASGIAGAFLQMGLTPEYMADVPCIGASGAISGILGAYMLLYPWEEVYCIYFSFTMRYATSITLSTIWVLGSWFILQFVNALWLSPQTAEASVAFWAHIGGFAFGAAVAAIFKYSSALIKHLQQRSLTFLIEEYSDLLKAGKTKDAAERLDSALKLDSSNPLVLGELGRFELGRNNPGEARKHFRQSLRKALEQKDDAQAAAAYLGLMAARDKPPDNAERLIIGRRFARLKKYGHALGIMGAAFQPDAEMRGLDKLLYEMAEIFAGPLKDFARAEAAYNLLIELFPHSPRSLDADYQLRKLRASGKTPLGT
ncbi:MAG: rhomboid family intramembrane serine protease [Candidatus Abyssobacteria bacterium SURF_17]|uniref:Rhomboid family intramembrane serine protease n=1 Tax=Candidatus Abyssobacteria bacterium SURF_17 TaxID=2093361 RepID=A0A419F0L3_9BACT|nr:MAG: rhomboid family intramembrane serine protease [Candidatus Abyssubacteria bacterium SURF_17]